MTITTTYDNLTIGLVLFKSLDLRQIQVYQFMSLLATWYNQSKEQHHLQLMCLAQETQKFTGTDKRKQKK
jgi:hypothetical protein